MGKQTTPAPARADGWEERQERLRAFRRLCGNISQANVARAAGLSPNRLTRVESGFEKLGAHKTRCAVALGYGLPIDVFDALFDGRIGAKKAAASRLQS